MMKRTPFSLSTFCCLLTVLGAGCSRAADAPAPAAAPPVADPWTQYKATYDYDTKQALDEKEVSEEQNFTGTTRRVTITGARGAQVPLYVILPANSARKAPGLVLLHGKGGRAEDMLFIGQYLAGRGYASVIPEIVEHGARRKAGQPVTMFNGSPDTLRDGLVESIQDIRRSIDYFAALPQVDNKRIGLIGISLGAIMGSITTAVDQRIATCILIVGGADWKIMLSQSQERDAVQKREQGGAKETDLQALEVIDPKNFVGHIAPRPVLMLNGRQDNIIPVDAAKALFEAAKEPKEQVWFDAGHSIPPTLAAAPMQEWLDDKLSAAATMSGASARATTPALALTGS